MAPGPAGDIEQSQRFLIRVYSQKGDQSLNLALIILSGVQLVVISRGHRIGVIHRGFPLLSNVYRWQRGKAPLRA
jgi:hypothetical protein